MNEGPEVTDVGRTHGTLEGRRRWTPRARLGVSLAAVALTVALAGCGGGGTPTTTTTTTTTVPTAVTTTTAASGTLSRCGARDPLDPSLAGPPAGSVAHC